MKRIKDTCCHTQVRKYARTFKFHQGAFDPYKDKVIDPAGYILIRINETERVIELAHCAHDHVITTGVKGKTAEEVYSTVIKMKLITQLEYAAYVGAELKKAEFALRHNTEYMQE